MLGVVIAGGSIVVALVLAATAPGARAQTISQFARAAAGCRTTIDVATSGTYIVVSEVRGALVDVDGSCPASAGRFDLGGSTAPAVAVVVRAADGTTVEVTPSQGGSYDTGTYAGAVAATLELSPGRYEVEVTSSSRAVVAIGADPDATVRTQRTAAAVVAAAGVASGAVVVATGRRRRR